MRYLVFMLGLMAACNESVPVCAFVKDVEPYEYSVSFIPIKIERKRTFKLFTRETNSYSTEYVKDVDSLDEAWQWMGLHKLPKCGL